MHAKGQNMSGVSHASQASISESNRSRILHYLYHEGVSSRAQIAKALGLTPAAITKITARLIEADVIQETGSIEGSKNRRSIGIALDSKRFHVIGVKFARSLVSVGVFDLDGNRVSLEQLPPVKESTIHRTLDSIRSTIEELLAHDDTIMAIGMAVPGPYLRSTGRTAVVSSMQGWRTINLREEFLHAFAVPVFIEQDARAGVLAQYLFDPAGPCDNLAYYLLGEGVGLGVIDGGHVINGAQGTATEIGHVSIDVHGRPCDCGNVGCLERYCSAVAIHEALCSGDLVPAAETMTHAQACAALFREACDGNGRAASMVKAIGEYVGYGCVTIIDSFNPERIVIGDIVAQGGDLLLRAAQDVVDERVIPELRSATSITISALPTDAAICGAASVAITQILNHPSTFFDVA